MNNMYEQHELGDIDIYIKVENFNGCYASMAKGVNGMVQSHINVKKKAMAIIEEYGNGNFDAIMEPLPGKKVFINNVLNKVQKNLQMIGDEVKFIAQKGADGDLSVRGNASKFTGDWKEIVDGLNDVLEAIVVPLNEANNVLGEMSSGNLNVSVNGEYKGDLDKLKQSINNLLFSFREMIKQISDGVDTTASTSYQMSSNADSLASASHEQSAQADEVASAVEEMSRTVLKML
ncbi:MAG: hypothetical protein NTW25_01290 [Candidatus Kapabacteria bacterium]|nr:hypothetical protein [Candidatus Kapabacteria bacterium]